MVDKMYEFDFEAELPKVKPKGKESIVPDKTWTEIVKAFEASGKPKAQIVLKDKLADLSLSTVIVKLRKATAKTSVAVVSKRYVAKEKTKGDKKKYVIDSIFLKRKEAKA